VTTKYLSVVFTGEDKSATKTFKQVDGAADKTQTKLSKFGNAIGSAVKVGAIAGVAVGVAAIGKGVTAFADFERSMNEVFTLIPGTSKEAMDAMTKDVKNFSTEFGVLPDRVVPALYQALSAGVPKDNVFEFLEVAQKAAKGGVTDLTVSVNGISSVINAYGTDVLSATDASDLMFTAVRLGKTSFEEMSASLFQVTPTAAALGVKFGDVTAALASMTAQGVPTSVATTQLRQLFVELSKEGTKTSDVFSKISGKSFKEFIAGGGNTQQALAMLEKHAGQTNVGINDLFGSVEAGSAALSLTGKGTETFVNNLAAMGEASGATDAAFEQMNTGLGPVIDKFKAFASVALIDIGEKIAPIILEVAGSIKAMFAAFKAGDGDVTSSGLAGVFERIGLVARDVYETVKPIFIEIVGSLKAFFAAFMAGNGDVTSSGLAGTFERIGNFARRGFNVAAKSVQFFSKYISFLIPFVGTLATAFVLYKGYLLAVSVVTKAVSVATAILNAVMSANPIMLVVIAIAALVGGLIYAYKNVEGFRKVVDNAFKIIQEVISYAWENVIKHVFNAIVFYITKILIPYYTLLFKIAKTIFEQIASVVMSTWNNVIKPIWNAIYWYIENILIPYYVLLWNVVRIVWDAISGAIGSAWSRISGAFESIKSGIASVWGFFQTAKDVISTVFSGISNAITAPFQAAFNGIKNLWNNTIGGFGFKVPDWVKYTGVGAAIAGKEFRIPTFAAGGMVGDGPFIVGEQGPELGFKVGSSVRIFSNPESQRMTGGAGMSGGTVNVYVTNAQASPYEIGKEVLWATKVAG
jgi:TP901 family phage tail tape measure protein